MPIVFAAIGTNEWDVIPGTVFTSKRYGFLSLSVIKSTLPHPEAPVALNASRANV